MVLNLGASYGGLHQPDIHHVGRRLQRWITLVRFQPVVLHDDANDQCDDSQYDDDDQNFLRHFNRFYPINFFTGPEIGTHPALQTL